MKPKIHIIYLKSVLMILLFVIITIPFALAQHEGHGGGGVRSSSVKEIENYNYVCPMHPEIVSDNSGICPKCGMILERKRSSESKASKKTHYYCQDHPSYESDKKGKCSTCGRKLKKAKEFFYK